MGHYRQTQKGKPFTELGPGRSPALDRRGCLFDGCDRALVARGLCNGHYQQDIAGKPLAPLRRRRSTGSLEAALAQGLTDCLACGEIKPVEDFSTDQVSGYPRAYCKVCNAERVRLSHYNIDRDFLDRLWGYQKERCAICESADVGSRRALHIDHDHACCKGRRSCGMCVRGLVCSSCNAYGLAWYEALPLHLRTYDVLNTYLSCPPAREFREAVRVGVASPS
ncbi:endonuclease domain-containing protein [Streptomyces sp. NPDC006422]|uniref:endonuclease domain-containing protein n=1 Tax=unclassified Streptomyces TaxID=2593676 RepID=UPI0033A76E27